MNTAELAKSLPNNREVKPNAGGRRTGKPGQARFSVDSYFDELERRGVTDFRQAMWAAHAFKIGLGEAKLAFINRQPGGLEAWERQFDELDLNALEGIRLDPRFRDIKAR